MLKYILENCYDSIDLIIGVCTGRDRTNLKIMSHVKNHSISCFSYSAVNSSRHSVECNTCDVDLNNESHTWSAWTPYDVSIHIKHCELCNFEVSASHTFESWVYYNTGKHKRTCTKCSATVYENHNYIYLIIYTYMAIMYIQGADMRCL